jgi:L-ascorbate metabolism protein UlaG (beta-lactamase superfamily)
MIENSGKTIYFDPYMITVSKPADYIFITHEHPDHCSPEDIKKISGKNTLIICPASCSKTLNGYSLKTVKPGECFDLDGLKCEVVNAYNVKKFFHRKKDNKAGYIIETGGKRIYHAGDTDLIPEMKEFKNIDVAFVPIGGLFTMGPKEASDAVTVIKPKIAVPMHYGIFKGLLSLLCVNNGGEFKRLAENNGIKVIVMNKE